MDCILAIKEAAKTSFWLLLKMEIGKCVNSLKAKSNSFILLIFIYSVLYIADIF